MCNLNFRLPLTSSSVWVSCLLRRQLSLVCSVRFYFVFYSHPLIFASCGVYQHLRPCPSSSHVSQWSSIFCPITQNQLFFSLPLIALSFLVFHQNYWSFLEKGSAGDALVLTFSQTHILSQKSTISSMKEIAAFYTNQALFSPFFHSFRAVSVIASKRLADSFDARSTATAGKKSMSH